VPCPGNPRQVLRAVAGDNDRDELTGEWPVNWSLASYEDVSEYFTKNLFKPTAAPATLLADVMSKNVTVTTPETLLKDAEKLFVDVSSHRQCRLVDHAAL
jgi:CBS domain-containing protein